MRRSPRKMGDSFDNNSTEVSTRRYRTPVNFVAGKGIGYLEIAELKRCPVLLSKSDENAKKLGLLIDAARDRAFARELNYEVAIRVTPQGHCGLELLRTAEPTTRQNELRLGAASTGSTVAGPAEAPKRKKC